MGRVKLKMKNKNVILMISLLMVSLVACGNLREDRTAEGEASIAVTTDDFTVASTVKDVIQHKAFQTFGKLFFPVDRAVSDTMTLKEVSANDVYVWYSGI